jgi:hypothetical protein
MAQIENTANVRKGKSFSHNKKKCAIIEAGADELQFIKVEATSGQ